MDIITYALSKKNTGGSSGATEEQATQIQTNTNNISELKEDISSLSEDISNLSGLIVHKLSDYVEFTTEEITIAGMKELFDYGNIELTNLPEGVYMLINDVNWNVYKLRFKCEGITVNQSEHLIGYANSSFERSVFISAKKTPSNGGYEVWLLHEMGYDSFIYGEDEIPGWGGFSYITDSKFNLSDE